MSWPRLFHQVTKSDLLWIFIHLFLCFLYLLNEWTEFVVLKANKVTLLSSMSVVLNWGFPECFQGMIKQGLHPRYLSILAELALVGIHLSYIFWLNNAAQSRVYRPGNKKNWQQIWLCLKHCNLNRYDMWKQEILIPVSRWMKRDQSHFCYKNTSVVWDKTHTVLLCYFSMSAVWSG